MPTDNLHKPAPIPKSIRPTDNLDKPAPFVFLRVLCALVVNKSLQTSIFEILNFLKPPF